MLSALKEYVNTYGLRPYRLIIKYNFSNLETDK